MEQEVKYAIDSKATADAIWTDPQLARLADPSTSQAIVMKAVYFDTKDRLLARNNMTLRVRAEGDMNIATLKWGGCSANGFHERNEINVPVSEDTSFIQPSADMFRGSEEGETLVGLLGDEPLLNLLETRFLRRQIRLTYNGSLMELALDCGSIITDAGEEPIMEMEIELYAGSVEDVLELGDKLARQYGLIAEDRTKFARGLAMLEKIA
jgi:inorganic triphosphatase YgiF